MNIHDVCLLFISCMHRINSVQCALLERVMKAIFDLEGVLWGRCRIERYCSESVCRCLASRPELIAVVYKHGGSEVIWILLDRGHESGWNAVRCFTDTQKASINEKREELMHITQSLLISVLHNVGGSSQNYSRGCKQIVTGIRDGLAQVFWILSRPDTILIPLCLFSGCFQ